MVSFMFFVARVTSLSIKKGDENIFNVPEGLQALFNTGLLGALMLTILGSISWQLVASAFPIALLSNPITYVLLRWCILLESTGICQGAWVLADIDKKIAEFQHDETYIRTAEERTKQDMSDNQEIPQVETGHLIQLPGFSENAPAALKNLLKKDASVRIYLDEITERMGQA
jgi:hypothetical protein